jgi:translocation and assembly module TamB
LGRFFLALRRIVLALLVIIGVVLGVVWYVAHAPMVIEEILDHFAPEYGVGYGEVRGSVIRGVEIHDITYKKEPLIESIRLRWRPHALLKREVAISSLEIEGVDVARLKEMVASVEKEDNDSSTSEPLDIALSVDRLKVTTTPFEEFNTTLSSLSFELTDLFLEKESVEISHSDLTIALHKSFDKILLERARLQLYRSKINLTNTMVERGDVTFNLASTIGGVDYRGEIRSNYLRGEMRLSPTKRLFDLYEIPIHACDLKEVIIDLNASQEHLDASLSHPLLSLSPQVTGGEDIAMRDIAVEMGYALNDNTLLVDAFSRVETPYTQEINITHQLHSKGDSLRYGGAVRLDRVVGIEHNITTLLDRLRIDYQGDLHALDANLSSKGLRGDIGLKGYQKGKITLETRNPIALMDYFALPKPFDATRMRLSFYAPFDLKVLTPLGADLNLSSNLLQMQSRITYDKTLLIDSIVKLPKETLLKEVHQEVKWGSIGAISLWSKVEKEEVEVRLFNEDKSLQLEADYHLKRGSVESRLDLGSLHLDTKGVVKERLDLNGSIGSLEALKRWVSRYYPLGEYPQLEGALQTQWRMEQMRSIKGSIASQKIGYRMADKVPHTIDNLKLSITKEEENITIGGYTLTFDGERLFATKPSVMVLGEENLSIEQFWVNDTLLIDGVYDLAKVVANLSITSENFPIKQEDFAIKSRLDLQLTKEQESIEVEGKVDLLGGDILYDLSKKRFASDSDIVIVQKGKRKKEEDTMKNLSLNIHLSTKKPLKYKQKGISIKSDASLSIQKSLNFPLMLFGSIKLLKGGYYTIEKKRFRLKEGFVYFTGDSSRPLLDIYVTYQAIDYLITIGITGEPNSPHVSFNSTPSLSKEEILSILLFDSQAGARSNSAEDMMKMMGGVVAKSLLSNFGVEVDTLVFGQDGSIEIGKRIGKDMTLIYSNENNLPEVRLNYRHGKHTKSVFGASEVSQSYDIIYKKDF